MQQQQLISYAITTVVVVALLAFRLRRMSQLRRLRLETLWVVPAIYLIFAGVMFYQFPPTAIGWAISAAALLAGAAIGWQRGKMMQIHVDPETHVLNQKASPAAMIFIVVLIAVRMSAKTILASGVGNDFHLSAMLVTDVLIALALGLFATTRLEMFLRARQMLAEVRGARA
jgi:fucose 4-O-acetylase-like acetyltransferase